MTFVAAYQVAFSVVVSLMFALWLCSLLLKDASIVDRFWGFGFVLIAWTLGIMQVSPNHLQALLIALVTIWGLRLSIYIHLRNRGHAEDYRYQEMRRKKGRHFWWYSLISVFFLQGVIMLIVAMPVIFVLAQDPQEHGWSLYAGVGFLIWATGFVFEAGGDFQLSQFKKDPANKGKLLTTGLWSLTRHPNYFGDACQWWGFGMFAWSYGMVGVLTFVGPVCMTFFIRKVSGVDLLESSMKIKKPGYAAYIARTPPFFPLLLKHRGRP